MDSFDNKQDLSKEEIDAIAERVHKESSETLARLNTEIREIEKYNEAKEKFYDKFGFTEELMQASQHPPIGEGDLDPAIQDFFNHFLKEVAADQAAQGVSVGKSKRTGIKLSRRGKMI